MLRKRKVRNPDSYRDCIDLALLPIAIGIAFILQNPMYKNLACFAVKFNAQPYKIPYLIIISFFECTFTTV